MSKQWNHNDLSALVPFKAPNMTDPKLPHIGYGVAGGANMPVPDMLFAFGGINAKAEHLLASSPMMYQGLSRIAAAMRAMHDEVEDAVAAGHIQRERVEYVLANYRSIENDCLTLMQIATDGIDATLKGMG